MSGSERRDVVVIGAGPAGLLAALRAGDLGVRTALVTRDAFGGMAAHDGPVPVRTLAQAARLLRDARELGRYGIGVSEPVLEYAKLLTRVREVTDDVRARAALREQITAVGVTVHEHAGAARFVDPHTVETQRGLLLRAEKFILCSGGVSRRLPVPGFELTATHSDAWSLTSVPPTMVVVGGGATGVQVASIFTAFGTRVQLIQEAARILPSWTADTSALNLASAGVETDSRGFVRVGAHLRTSAPHIFAAGDVTGRWMLVPHALQDGFVAGSNAARTPMTTVSDEVCPIGSFTNPEYAQAGLTEAKARQTHDVVVALVRFDTTTRTIIDGRTTGFCKLVVDRASRKILGCHVVGERAVDLVQTAAIAIAAGMRVDELARVPLSFPTYTGVLGRVAAIAARECQVDVDRVRLAELL
ncbi:NAD(P)/FAD-dependent oxidoreductase [Myxococcus sp. AM009]|uniref:dihydrolipoyl dehydrogenase family protein n=1 Tax=unclassified Myxococcus TaxID=2648731 RepID=UPI0015959D43|nr:MULTISPECIES: NAD(P)/FAD-dependent oxidoreductase [unclassified Myxococcus]NVI96721.1 NAD(P)/FAD-dependent oxidoreductase [Myxococcus sp. AM009]NVJ14682.1 NAD(P)/FAD-dependent oxidoreductase [Myxococcus sp. AM010]